MLNGSDGRDMLADSPGSVSHMNFNYAGERGAGREEKEERMGDLYSHLLRCLFNLSTKGPAGHRSHTPSLSLRFMFLTVNCLKEIEARSPVL